MDEQVVFWECKKPIENFKYQLWTNLVWPGCIDWPAMTYISLIRKGSNTGQSQYEQCIYVSHTGSAANAAVKQWRTA